MNPSQHQSLDQLFADLLKQQNDSSSTLPPVHLWHPQKTGDMDMRIDREGQVDSRGAVRLNDQRLVKLFARILQVGKGDCITFCVTRR